MNEIQAIQNEMRKAVMRLENAVIALRAQGTAAYNKGDNRRGDTLTARSITISSALSKLKGHVDQFRYVSLEY